MNCEELVASQHSKQP